MKNGTRIEMNFSNRLERAIGANECATIEVTVPAHACTQTKKSMTIGHVMDNNLKSPCTNLPQGDPSPSKVGSGFLLVTGVPAPTCFGAPGVPQQQSGLTLIWAFQIGTHLNRSGFRNKTQRETSQQVGSVECSCYEGIPYFDRLLTIWVWGNDLDLTAA